MTNKSPSRGFFRNAFDAMITARERQAQHYVSRMAHLYGNDFFGSDDKSKSD